jgi:hypothetical protein
MVKVLFIAGGGRTGSTILHNVLGQIDGFFAVGELRYVWGRAALNNQSCGCGVRFSECAFWREAMARAFGGLDRDMAREMLGLTESFRVHKLPLLAVPAIRRHELARLAVYRERLVRLYSAIQEVSGCRVIVDSSKNPAYGYLLGRIDGIDAFYLHFVRDALPVAYSWGRRKDFEQGVAMARKDAIASAMQWMARNLTAELFLPRGTRMRRLRYEDLMARPRDHVASLMPWLGEPTVDLPFASQHTVRIDEPNHSVFGNSVRFQRGTVTLRRDDRWRAGMRRADRLKVACTTWPLRVRYGYAPPDGSAARRITRRVPA